MGAIVLPPDIATTIADLQAAVRQLATYRPSPPQLAPPAFALLNSATGSAAITLPGTLGGLGATNTSFTLAAAGSVMVIGTGSIGVAINNNMSGSASVGVSGHGFAPLALATLADNTGAVTSFMPAASIYVVSLAAGTFTAQWQGIANTTATMSNWSVFVFQLGAGTVAIP
jgi:hypothetical protein